MKISLKKILLWAGALLGLVAFFMMFADAVKETASSTLGTEVSYLKGSDALFGYYYEGEKVTEGAGGAFVGYLLALLAGVGATVASFVVKNEKINKIVAIACAAVMVVGAILIFCEKAMWMGANDVSEGTILGMTVSYSLAAGPIVGGILTILGAGSIGASVVVK